MNALSSPSIYATAALLFLVLGCGRPTAPSVAPEAPTEAAPAPAVAPDSGPWRDTGDYGHLIAPGRYRATGQAGGPRRAGDAYDESCEGLIDDTPDHQLSVSEDAGLHLEVRPKNSDHHIGLVVVGYERSLCAAGLGPGMPAYLDGPFPAGVYEVYVAAMGEEHQLAPYTITMATEGVSEAVPDPFTDTGEYGHLIIPGSYRSRGVAGGPRAAAEVSDGRCRGQIDNTPDHNLSVTSPVEALIELQPADPSRRISLVVVGPMGTECHEPDEDGKILLQTPMTQGTYDVYIAALRPEDANAAYAIRAQAEGSVAGAADDGWDDTGPYGVLRLPGPTRASGQAGGQQESPPLHGDGCPGWIDTAPDHFLQVSEAGDYQIEARSNERAKDITLVVVPVGREGTMCSDDRSDTDKNPLVSDRFEAGNYGVYIGAKTLEDQHTGYTVEARSVR